MKNAVKVLSVFVGLMALQFNLFGHTGDRVEKENNG